MSRIQELNDAFRKTLQGGRVLITAGVGAPPPTLVAEALQRVRTFDAFTEENNPYGEYDFGSFELAGRKFFWKIEYYDKSMTYGSEDPAGANHASFDGHACGRVLRRGRSQS